ncbi:MAG: aminopeptidase P family protein [Lachnospiraceae bacterium]|nr:aminopeptidase P family protein [Lachnospiraceae bacterium]
MEQAVILEKVKEALRYNKMAYDAVRKGFRRGMSEKDVKALITSACGNIFFTGDFVGGARSGEVEGEATDYILREGDTLILDLQFQYEGVWTDTTRTFFIGMPDEEVREVYDMVCRAKKAGEAVLKEGVRACEVYDAVRTAFSPYEGMFPHHAGHLFGTEPMMQPQLLPDKDGVLKTGDLVTLEPGLYPEGRFGIRVEDNYVITQSGCCNLFDYSIELKDFVL